VFEQKQMDVGGAFASQCHGQTEHEHGAIHSPTSTGRQRPKRARRNAAAPACWERKR
jgi:hypothetical protein